MVITFFTQNNETWKTEENTDIIRMSSGHNLETPSNPPNPGRGVIVYCRAAPGIDHVTELYQEDILRNSVLRACIQQ